MPGADRPTIAHRRPAPGRERQQATAPKESRDELTEPLVPPRRTGRDDDQLLPHSRTVKLSSRTSGKNVTFVTKKVTLATTPRRARPSAALQFLLLSLSRDLSSFQNVDWLLIGGKGLDPATRGPARGVFGHPGGPAPPRSAPGPQQCPTP